jgi:methionine-gamma-lyase
MREAHHCNKIVILNFRSMNRFNPAQEIQNLQFFGEFGGVNPSIEDSSTYTFLQAQKMTELFEKEVEGCYLYSRHMNPTNRYLSQALARVEHTEDALVTASGISAIACTLLQLCSAGDEIISSRMIYGGTYAFLKNVVPRFGIRTAFVDMRDMKSIEHAITGRTKVVFCETMSNPLLEITDIRSVSSICKKYNLQLVVDNTFTPLIVTPALLGADVVIHSLTKFINGTSDTVAGAICGSHAFMHRLIDVNSGTLMLLGPVMDSLRAASVLKNLHSLPVRMVKHSANALYLATRLSEAGIRVIYPGLPSHPQHELFRQMAHPDFGFGGMMVMDMGTTERAFAVMETMQQLNVGYLAVSLGFYKTLFSSPGSSTSSEIPEDERHAMGMSDGLVRMSIGLDHDPEIAFQKIMEAIRTAEKN